jgi:hypothetical protein
VEATPRIERRDGLLDLEEAEVETYVDELFESFGGASYLIDTFLHHAERIGTGSPPGVVLSPAPSPARRCFPTSTQSRLPLLQPVGRPSP